ncbi:MAG TPA: TonB-dependent receptor [Rhizomicrobium sp.]|nr:TonB-dependent receptor [Rhizomicrobium sp.]
MPISLLNRMVSAAGAGWLLLTAAASAQSHAINIPAQDLKTALDTYIRQSGVQLVYTVNDLEGQRSSAVQGQLEPAVALDHLLRGTRLAANRDPSGAVIVSRKATVAPNDPPGAPAAGVETVVVTGSRVISDVANSPTPLTEVSQAQLLATTPSGDIPTALNKLPIFNGSVTVRNSTNAGSNATGAVLNLRNFGTQRTLVLLDGHRITPANANGTVDVDTLPTMLIQRVDVVTGGASSVYGSDAVTGVVNYVLDKHFNGFKINVNGGISNYADAASYNLGVAVGTDFLGGRAHFEGSLRRFSQDGVLQNQRELGRQNWGVEGLGTVANPFTDYPYTGDTKAGGKITCSGCAANGMRLSDAGLIVPYNIGTPTGTPNFTSNGDGGHTSNSQLTASLETNEAFGRLSYSINDTVTAYLQFSANESYTKSAFQDHEFTSGITGTFFVNNPYVPAADQALLANPNNTFAVAFLWNQGYPRAGEQSNGLNRNLSGTFGLDGSWGNFEWDLYYTHGENRLDEKAVNNQNQQRMFAGEDAVVDIRPGLPTTGTVVCYVSTTQFASLYPGCVPANPFIKANYINDPYNRWIGTTTYFHQTTMLDDLGGTLSGTIFDLPAGPIKAALSGESRWQSFGIVSNANPTVTVNCTGLRICNPAAALYQNNVVASLPTVSLNVWEFAAEANVPVLKDVPLVQSLNVDLAGRYTDYSTSGAVQTWKIGIDWHLDDNLRLRATNSVDIRAPTLNDLYSPISRGATSYNDILTSFSGQLQTQSQGNPNLTPEVARTYTAGLVFTPSFLPNFTASVDYYDIVLKNAISSVNGTATSVQQVCINSNGTSPFCSLYIRPIPWGAPGYNTSANFPSFVLSENLNTAFNKIEGLDVEADYHFDLADIEESLPGSMSLRLLANIQPVNESLQYVGAPLTFLPYNKGRVTGFVSYTVGSWSIDLENRWYGNYTRMTNIGQVYVNPRVPTRDYLDVTVNKEFGDGLTGYFSVQNVGNVQPPIAPTLGIVPGLFFLGASPRQYDPVGRYFTIGFRANL